MKVCLQRSKDTNLTRSNSYQLFSVIYFVLLSCVVDVSELRNNLHVSDLTMSSDNSGFDDYETSSLGTLAVHSSPKPTASGIGAKLKLEDPFPNETFLQNSIMSPVVETLKEENNLNEFLCRDVNENSISNMIVTIDNVESERSNALVIVEDLTDIADHQVEYAAKGEVDDYPIVQYQCEIPGYGQKKYR